MNQEQRKQAAERIQKRSDWYTGLCSDNQYTMQSHDDRVELLTLLATAEREVERLRETQVYLYNSGYLAGHHDTVEGCWADIHFSDYHTDQSDMVDEVLDELLNQQEGE